MYEYTTRVAAWRAFFMNFVSYSCFCYKLRNFHGFTAVDFAHAELLPDGRRILVRRFRPDIEPLEEK